MHTERPLRVPVGRDAERWRTFPGERTPVVAARTVVSTTRVLECLPAVLRDDSRVSVVFAYDPTSAFNDGVLDLLHDSGCRVMPWSQLGDVSPDPVLTASENVDLPEGTCPVQGQFAERRRAGDEDGAAGALGHEGPDLGRVAHVVQDDEQAPVGGAGAEERGHLVGARPGGGRLRHVHVDIAVDRRSLEDRAVVHPAVDVRDRARRPEGGDDLLGFGHGGRVVPKGPEEPFPPPLLDRGGGRLVAGGPRGRDLASGRLQFRDGPLRVPAGVLPGVPVGRRIGSPPAEQAPVPRLRLLPEVRDDETEHGRHPRRGECRQLFHRFPIVSRGAPTRRSGSTGERSTSL